MHLGGAGPPEQSDHVRRRRATHDAVVDHDDALTGEHLRKRVELRPHAELAEVLVGLDERPSHVPVLDEPEPEGDAGGLRIADARGVGGVRHRDD